MLQNIIKVSIRNFFRHGLYSLINIVGLTSALVCALLIYLWVHDEVAKDSFHKDAERIYLAAANLQMTGDEVVTWTNTPGQLGEDIREHSPEAEAVARTNNAGSLLLQNNDRSFMERGLYADPSFFNLFSFPVIEGTPTQDTARVDWICLSKSVARKLFPEGSPIGKTIHVDRERDHEVVAVFDDIGTESSLKFDFVIPFEVFKKKRGEYYRWSSFDNAIYVKLAQGADLNRLLEGITARRKHAERASNDPSDITFFLVPFSKHYLNGRYENGFAVGGRIRYVRIFSVVGIFILIVAAINFTNMATARASSRTKEVGMRKVVGAQRRTLVAQFLAESMVLSLSSMILAIGAVALILPVFNSTVNKQIDLPIDQWAFIAVLIGIVVVTGLMAGLYPALDLSAYRPVEVLRGAGGKGHAGNSFRRSLVIFQFFVTVILISSSFVVYQQIDFIFNTNLGYDRDAVISFPLRDKTFASYASFKAEAEQIPGVTMLSRADNSLVQVNNQNNSVTWPGKPDQTDVMFRTVCVDFDYLEVMGMKLEEGRFFRREFNDTTAFVLTHRAVEVMGLKEPVGATITQWGKTGKIVGVVNDFHSRSIHGPIDPVIFMFRPEWSFRAFAKVDATRVPEVISGLEKLSKRFVPDFPFSYTFLDDDFETMYRTEKTVASLCIAFTVMAVIISALGLLGLATYTAEKRRKEISIRKTLGASVMSIISLMSTDFVRLSLTASLLGCPVAFLLMTWYLSSYAYHAEISSGIFVITAAIVFAITLFVILIQVTRAALANPTDALRNE